LQSYWTVIVAITVELVLMQLICMPLAIKSRQLRAQDALKIVPGTIVLTAAWTTPASSDLYLSQLCQSYPECV